MIKFDFRPFEYNHNLSKVNVPFDITWIWIYFKDKPRLKLAFHIDYLFGNEHFTFINSYLRNDKEEATLTLDICAFGISIGVFK